jgi:ubiquinone/menaquinone biosynthesis C-methylase UbiE
MQAREHDLLRAVEDAHWWHRTLRAQVLRVLPPHARVLDAGCGTGGMLSVLHSFDAHGIDASPSAIQHCQQRGLSRVSLASVHALPFPDASFDAVLSLDVLYHANVDEARALAEMRRVLKPGGLLVMNLPAFECLRGSHDVAVSGVRRYTSCHVQRLLRLHSLKPEMTHYWNAWLFLPLLLWRRWGGMRQSDLQLPCGLLNGPLAALGRLDAMLCRVLRVPFGSSLFVTARHDG